jgi:CRP-like cAMP-binding protein
MQYGAYPSNRPIETGKINRCLASLPAKDFALLAPHLRAVPLERGAMLHDAGDELDHVYFPHSGMSVGSQSCAAARPSRLRS